jgi:hypothetical protein
LEGGLVFLLCKTQSRGALLALILAGAHWHWLAVKAGRVRRLSLRLAFLVACIGFAGFTARIDPSYISNDLSIRNRLALWKGCLKVFAVSPLGGCGAGSSGRLFRAWFQPLDWTQWYPTPVNSYLHAGIEFGPIVLGTALIFMIFAVAAPLREGIDTDSIWTNLAWASGSSIVAWSAASMFSTLWDEYLLWIVPIVAISLGFARALFRRRILAPLIIAIGSTVVLEGSAKIIAWQLVRREKIIPRILGDGITRVVAAHPGPSSWPICHLWLDRDVTGADPERELRKWLGLAGCPPILVVHDRWSNPRFDPRDGDVVVLFGRSAERLGRTLNRNYARVILIHPIDPYRDSLELSANAVVVIPEIDQDGSLERLRTFTPPKGLRIVTPGLGEDIRPAWPGVMAPIDQLYRRARTS